MCEKESDQRNKEADESWADYQRTGQFVSNEAMTAWLDTWGTDRERLEPLLLEALEESSAQEFTPDFFERLREWARKAINEKIGAGIAAAERGEFATEAEMEQIFNRYQTEK